MNNDMRGIY